MEDSMVAAEVDPVDPEDPEDPEVGVGFLDLEAFSFLWIKDDFKIFSLILRGCEIMATLKNRTRKESFMGSRFYGFKRHFLI